jgi:putative PIN family toxin of toxin-antitoxin system
MTAAPSPPRIVLDTNVCLDLFLFRDPSCARLLAALQAGTVRAVTREDCRAEWQRVLHYPQLPIDEAQRPSLREAYDALLHGLPDAAAPDDAPLPRCRDPDDQKFLELAWAARAGWLLSKDNELLKLDRRARQLGRFAILLPQDWSLPPAERAGTPDHV